MAKLSAKRLRELLAEVRVRNGWNLAGDKRRIPYITYRAQQSGRVLQSAAWQVIIPGFMSDPSSSNHWQNNGHKTFPIYGRVDKAAVLEMAMTWLAERKNIPNDDWAKTPFGDWMHRPHLEVRLSELLPGKYLT